MLVLLLKFISFFLSEKILLNREELSAYECGFEHHNISRLPFSLRYYFLTLVFLLFDLEIVFLIFTPLFFLSGFFYLMLLFSFIFITFLFFGLVYEWSDGGLEWLR